MNISSSLKIWLHYHKGRYLAILKIKVSEENMSLADVSKWEIACN